MQIRSDCHCVVSGLTTGGKQKPPKLLHTPVVRYEVSSDTFKSYLTGNLEQSMIYEIGNKTTKYYE